MKLIFRALVHRAGSWHVAHKGESLCHIGYLGALYLGFEHLHVLLAGACVAFIFLGGALEFIINLMED